jgi:hypothetical protein
MTRAVRVTAAVLGNLLGIAQSGYWCEWFFDVGEGYLARGRAIVSRVKTRLLRARPVLGHQRPSA